QVVRRSEILARNKTSREAQFFSENPSTIQSSPWSLYLGKKRKSRHVFEFKKAIEFALGSPLVSLRPLWQKFEEAEILSSGNGRL
ncbi:MAG: hypothetical protein MHMPM18_003715, partial [Marteilia pararefringens]